MSSSWRVPTAEERELIVDWKRRIDGRLRPILLLCMVPEIVMPVVIFILFIVSGKDPGKVLWIFALLLLFLPFTLALWFINSRATKRVRRGDFRVKDANVMDVFRNKDGELTVKAELSSGEVMEIPASGTIWKALSPGAAGYYLSFDKEVLDESDGPETMSAHTSSNLKMYIRSRITDTFYPAFRAEERGEV